MYDPLKEFVDRNRIDFDDQEAPIADWSKIKKTTPIKAHSPTSYRWLWMAASTIIILGVGLLAYNHQSAMYIESSLVNTNGLTNPISKAEEAVKPKAWEKQVTDNNSVHLVVNEAKPSRKLNLDGLSDSSSASNRLLAILNLEKSAQMNLELAQKMAITMGQDGNTNVRLAALNLLNQHKQKAYISDLLIQSLDTQNDPMVQLGLINSIGRSNNPLVNQRLLQMVEKPSTFAMVRDEAYFLLMTHNAL